MTKKITQAVTMILCLILYMGLLQTGIFDVITIKSNGYQEIVESHLDREATQEVAASIYTHQQATEIQVYNYEQDEWKSWKVLGLLAYVTPKIEDEVEEVPTEEEASRVGKRMGKLSGLMSYGRKGG